MLVRVTCLLTRVYMSVLSLYIHICLLCQSFHMFCLYVSLSALPACLPATFYPCVPAYLPCKLVYLPTCPSASMPPCLNMFCLYASLSLCLPACLPARLSTCPACQRKFKYVLPVRQPESLLACLPASLKAVYLSTSPSASMPAVFNYVLPVRQPVSLFACLPACTPESCLPVYLPTCLPPRLPA